MNQKKYYHRNIFAHQTQRNSKSTRTNGSKNSFQCFKKTDIVVTGREAGTKLIKGIQSNVKIVWEHQLYELLGIETNEEPLKGPLSNYLLEFYAMVDELMTCPNIEIMYLNVSKPAKSVDAKLKISSLIIFLI